MGLDAPEGVDQRISESVGIGKAREPGYTIELVPFGGDDMRLLVADHLQPILDAAEEEIDLDQLAGRFVRDPAAHSQEFQCFDSAARPKLRVTAPAMSCWVCAKNSMSRI